MANRKISDLTALTAPATGDLLPIVDISEAAAADKNKKITYSDFLNNIPTGTITSTMILDGTILNADINASAAIVDTKLATIATGGKVSNSDTTATDANTASAIVARDASGNFSAGTITAALTGAASSNVLKAGDTMTGALVVPLASAATPSLTFTGDLDSGVFSPGANQVAVATNGTGRLFVDASGNIGAGYSTPGNFAGGDLGATRPLVVGDGTASTNVNIFSDSTGYGHLAFSDGTSGTSTYAGLIQYYHTTNSMALYTAATERLRITAAGLVGVGTSAPASTLHVAGTFRNTGQAYLGIGEATTLAYIGDPFTTNTRSIIFNRATGVTDIVNIQGLNAGVGLTDIALQAGGGRVGVGTSTFSYLANKLVIDKGSTVNDGITIVSSNTSNACIWFADGTTGSEIYRGGIDYNHSTDLMQIYTGAQGNIVIDSAGRLGIGNTSPQAKLEIAQSLDNTDGPKLRIANNANTLSNGQLIGGIDFFDGDDSGEGVGAYIYSYTTDSIGRASGQDLRFGAGESERMRLDS